MNIKHRVRINPRMVERANNARRAARRAPIPPMKVESDKRPAVIDKIVQAEIDTNDDVPLLGRHPCLKLRPMCPHWPGCGCGTQSGPHTCEWDGK